MNCPLRNVLITDKATLLYTIECIPQLYTTAHRYSYVQCTLCIIICRPVCRILKGYIIQFILKAQKMSNVNLFEAFVSSLNPFPAHRCQHTDKATASSHKEPLSSIPQPSPQRHNPPSQSPLSSSESEDESVEYTGSAFTYDSPNGISLHFPTVAECEAAIKISIKVVNDDYILPEGYEDMDLVSSMFKITASADLPAPVTVRMEHCAVVEEDDSLVHMIAHGPPPYKFKPLESGKFPIGECYGEIEMKNFCTLTQSQKHQTPMSLSVHVFYHDHRSATFVATKDFTTFQSSCGERVSYCYHTIQDINVMQPALNKEDHPHCTSNTNRMASRT